MAPRRDHQHDHRQRQWHRDGYTPPRRVWSVADIRHDVIQDDDRDREQQHVLERRRQQRRHPGRGQRCEGNLGSGPGRRSCHTRRRLQLHQQRRQSDDRHGGADGPGHDLDVTRLADRAATAGLYDSRRPDRDGYLLVRQRAIRPVQRPCLHVPEPDLGQRHLDDPVGQSVGFRRALRDPVVAAFVRHRGSRHRPVRR